MDAKSIPEIKKELIAVISDFLYVRGTPASVLLSLSEKDCAEITEHYCRALSYLSQIKED